MKNSVTATYFKLFLAALLAGAITVGSVYGAPATPAKGKVTSGVVKAASPEVISAKTLLEELIVRRYAQELSTLVDRQAFSMGAQLDVVEIPQATPNVFSATEPNKAPLSDIPFDLTIGSLDPEELIKKYGNPAEVQLPQGFLKNFKIKGVTISVGLREDLGPEAKADVEKWLNERLKTEFGTGAKGNVSLIKMPVPKATPPKTIWDWLGQFQSLAGQIVLTLGLLLGVVLWGLFAARTKKSEADVNKNGQSGVTAVNSVAGPGAKDGADAGKLREVEQAENVRLANEIKAITQDLASLAPRLSKQFEGIIRSWCAAGDDGRRKLACFAEAVGRDLGKLPIPEEALEDLAKIFSSMSETKLNEKRDLLQKAYWDLLMALNLGSESLDQPFGYLNSVSTSTMTQLLVEQNAKLKTLVTLYMPQGLREKYVQSLSEDAKKELLQSAAGMTEIPSDELHNIDGIIKGKLRPETNKNMVPLGMSLTKLASSLGFIEQVTLLSGMQGPAIQEYKRTVPSLAFVGEWPDEALGRLLAAAQPDEVVALARIRPDLKDRMLSLCAPMTAEVAADELSRSNNLNQKYLEQQLKNFARRLKEMVDIRYIDLEDIFAATDGSAAKQQEANKSEKIAA